MEAVTPTRSGALHQWGEHAVTFFRDVRTELRKVNWPARDELVKATRMIVILTVALGLAIGLLDLLLNLILVDGLARITR
jgi:preprotein translocase subunit SecE